MPTKVNIKMKIFCQMKRECSKNILKSVEKLFVRKPSHSHSTAQKILKKPFEIISSTQKLKRKSFTPIGRICKENRLKIVLDYDPALNCITSILIKSCTSFYRLIRSIQHYNSLLFLSKNGRSFCSKYTIKSTNTQDEHSEIVYNNNC